MFEIANDQTLFCSQRLVTKYNYTHKDRLWTSLCSWRIFHMYSKGGTLLLEKYGVNEF